jgi:predicted DCC family thiol-disulfide oxidoreductase YuxK
VPGEPELLFYDGGCGLCHRSVRFVAAKDRKGAFRFAPIGGETFLATVPAAARAGLPDSIVVLGRDGQLRVKSDGTILILERLGGGWRVLSALLRLLPRGVRDAGYDFVARHRIGWFGRAEQACPLVPPHLRGRFAP